MQVNSRIAKYLKDHGIKRVFVAKKTGMSKSILYSSLAGRRKITAEELKKIAEALGVDPNIFLE